MLKQEFRFQNQQWVLVLVLHVGLAVRALVVLQVAVLGDQLVGFLPLLLLHHRVPHLHVSAAQLVSGQELHDAGADRVSQDVGGGPKAVPDRRDGFWSVLCLTSEPVWFSAAQNVLLVL